MAFLEGKRILILGVASKLSIATGIARAMHREGAELAFTYQNERLGERVRQIAESTGSNLLFPCDVTSDTEIARLFTDLAQSWD
ncbi:MAG: SDR family oxidoreductase, partial [Gammaproteobacteria bacterium]|nr:SDR family oxidoreductase [Gammaproteobacteria bacterium]